MTIDLSLSAFHDAGKQSMDNIKWLILVLHIK